MFCVRKRQITITRGDTGLITVEPQGGYTPTKEDRAIFTVAEMPGGKDVISKIITPDESGIVRIPLSSADTNDLPMGRRPKMYTWSLRYALGAVVSGEAVTGWREMVTPPPGEFIILEANSFPVGVSCPKDERLEIQIESLKGERGEKGEKGEPGVQGERGPQGIQGEKGEMGPKGDPLTFDDLTSAQKAELKGEKGDTGPQGSAGPQGERGERGPEGIAGATGPQGIQGDTGPRGPKGDTFTFADLSPEQLESLRGPKGNTGATGAKGDKGDKGDKGEKGDPGLPGKIQSLRVNGVDIEPDENGVADIGETTVIDDTQIDGKPWSSKRIVDTLCSKMEKTGSLVQMDGLVEGYPLGVKVSWTPTQEGEGDPSPENIRPIHGRTEIKVERREDDLAYTLALPSTVYGGEVDEATGEGRREWRCITITGREPCHIFETLFYIDCYKMDSFVKEPVIDYKNGKCSHYPYQLYGENGFIGISLDGGAVVYRPGAKYPLTNDGLREWMDYLAAQYAAGTPVQIAYQLADSVPFTATGGAAIPALSGTNTVLTDADSMTVTGRADPIQTVAKLSDRIAALEAAATGINE